MIVDECLDALGAESDEGHGFSIEQDCLTCSRLLLSKYE
jgi:hypothetical protein